ncbi:hypothetical protein O3P69_008862 [Scylla paramamosain]|uniref:Uncharacterized protein n=1 Tax=Scylla paramamosain TaxID=85552 RepID=A0AAW0TPR0_SCYPA
MPVIQCQKSCERCLPQCRACQCYPCGEGVVNTHECLVMFSTLFPVLSLSTVQYVPYGGETCANTRLPLLPSSGRGENLHISISPVQSETRTEEYETPGESPTLQTRYKRFKHCTSAISTPGARGSTLTPYLAGSPTQPLSTHFTTPPQQPASASHDHPSRPDSSHTTPTSHRELLKALSFGSLRRLSLTHDSSSLDVIGLLARRPLVPGPKEHMRHSGTQALRVPSRLRFGGPQRRRFHKTCKLCQEKERGRVL